MEITEQLTGFYEAIESDQRITPIHISIYMAIVLAYLIHSEENPIQIDRDVLMQHAKISARSTYYKSLQQLHEYGYIKYIPSYNFYLGSLVYLKRT
jgi:hypothetical protein